MEEEKLFIVKNNKGETIKIIPNFGFNNYIACYNMDLIEIISIPNNCNELYCDNNQLTSLPKDLEYLYCTNNNIKQLPDLRNYKNLIDVCCDMCCFETYMVEMKNTRFNFVC